MRWRRGCLGRRGTAPAAARTIVLGRASETRRELARWWTDPDNYTAHTSQSEISKSPRHSHLV